MHTPHVPPPDESTLANYLAGRLDSAEREHVDQWLDAEPNRRGMLLALRYVALHPTERPTPGDVVKLRTAFWARVRQEESSNIASDLSAPQRRRSTRLGVNDQLLPGARRLALGKRILRENGHTQKYFLRWVLGLTGATLFATVAIVSQRQAAPEPVQLYRTAPGQRSTIRTADGSTIILAPATSVAMSSNTIDVTGEAAFTIAPNNFGPRTVRTSNAVVRVLGTTFVVRHYATETRTRIAVVEGRVSVQTRTKGSAFSTVLSPRMLAQVTDSGGTVSSGIAVEDLTSWTHGTLVFRNDMLRDVIAELVRAYGVEIRIADTTLAKRLVRTEVSVTEEPLNQVLLSICNVTDAHLTHGGHTYVISPGRMAERSPRPVPSRHQLSHPERQYGR